MCACVLGVGRVEGVMYCTYFTGNTYPYPDDRVLEEGGTFFVNHCLLFTVICVNAVEL